MIYNHYFRPITTILDTVYTAALEAATLGIRPTDLVTCATTDPDTLPTAIWTVTDTAITTPDMETSTPPLTLRSVKFLPDTDPDTLPTDIWTVTDTVSTTPDMETSTPPLTRRSIKFLPDTEPDMGPLDTTPDMELPDMEDMAAATDL